MPFGYGWSHAENGSSSTKVNFILSIEHRIFCREVKQSRSQHYADKCEGEPAFITAVTLSMHVQKSLSNLDVSAELNQTGTSISLT